jgi:hypothetical protein
LHILDAARRGRFDRHGIEAERRGEEGHAMHGWLSSSSVGRLVKVDGARAWFSHPCVAFRNMCACGCVGPGRGGETNSKPALFIPG